MGKNINLVTLQEFTKQPHSSPPAHWQVENLPHQTGIQITQRCQGAVDMPRWMACLFAMKTHNSGLEKHRRGKLHCCNRDVLQRERRRKALKIANLAPKLRSCLQKRGWVVLQLKERIVKMGCCFSLFSDRLPNPAAFAAELDF